MASVERKPLTGGSGVVAPSVVQGQNPWSGIQGQSPLKLVTFLYSECISCALLVVFCIAAAAANFCKYSTLGELHRKLQLQLHKLPITEAHFQFTSAQIANYRSTFSIYKCTNQHQLHTKISHASNGSVRPLLKNVRYIIKLKYSETPLKVTNSRRINQFIINNVT